MIRFVDLTDVFGLPTCAFIDASTSRFVENDWDHTFMAPEHLNVIDDKTLRERCRALVPDGFWEGK